MAMEKVKIGSLVMDPQRRPVYIRDSGEVFCKLTSEFHVRCMVTEDGQVQGAGKAEELDPEELVQRVN